jgi:hypothetical protein
MGVSYKEFKEAFNAFDEEEVAFRANMIHKDLEKYLDQCERRRQYSDLD